MQICLTHIQTETKAAERSF